jgi:ribosomal protein L39E
LDRRDVWVGLKPTERLQASRGRRHWAKEHDE